MVEEDSISDAVAQFKTRREFRSDRVGNILVPVGKVTPHPLRKWLQTLCGAVECAAFCVLLAQQRQCF